MSLCNSALYAVGAGILGMTLGWATAWNMFPSMADVVKDSDDVVPYGAFLFATMAAGGGLASLITSQVAYAWNIRSAANSLTKAYGEEYGKTVMDASWVLMLISAPAAALTIGFVSVTEAPLLCMAVGATTLAASISWINSIIDSPLNNEAKMAINADILAREAERNNGNLGMAR